MHKFKILVGLYDAVFIGVFKLAADEYEELNRRLLS